MALAAAKIKSIGNGLAEIQLTKGLAAIINEGDAETVMPLSWYPSTGPSSKTHYVRGRINARVNRSAIHLHRLLLCFPLFSVDHINGNGLDNRRCNLRAATQQQNSCNIPLRQDKTSIYRGVCLQNGRWSASIRFQMKLINLGLYDTEEEAAVAYDIASDRLHGEFGNKNFASVYELVNRKLAASATREFLKRELGV